MKSFGSCISVMVSESPIVTPRSTGFATKFEARPKPRSLASRNQKPVIMTSTAASVSGSASAWTAESVATPTASTRAEELVADTIAKRLRPMSR